MPIMCYRTQVYPYISSLGKDRGPKHVGMRLNCGWGPDEGCGMWVYMGTHGYRQEHVHVDGHASVGVGMVQESHGGRVMRGCMETVWRWHRAGR